jgi:hypothetical protein
MDAVLAGWAVASAAIVCALAIEGIVRHAAAMATLDTRTVIVIPHKHGITFTFVNMIRPLGV